MAKSLLSFCKFYLQVGYFQLNSSFLGFMTCRKSRPELFCKKRFLEISQNSQESNCARVSFSIIKFLNSLHYLILHYIIRLIWLIFCIRFDWWSVVIALSDKSDDDYTNVDNVKINLMKTSSFKIWIQKKKALL